MSLVDNFLMDDGEIGIRDKVAISIDRLRAFEPPEGYYLAFSGGKDSQCIYQLAEEAGVKFDAHYNVTTVDPFELIGFIFRNYPAVKFEPPELTMRQLIIKKGTPPLRKFRYCCSELKEKGGIGRVCVTGVRNKESASRSGRRAFEIQTNKYKDRVLFNDNGEERRMFETCTIKGKRVVNPIIDWTDGDVWEFIHSRDLEYCKLYDEGFTRLGCIGCPLASINVRIREFERYPQVKAMYVSTFDKMIAERLRLGKPTDWKDGAEVFEYWVREKPQNLGLEDNLTLEDFDWW